MAALGDWARAAAELRERTAARVEHWHRAEGEMAVTHGRLLESVDRDDARLGGAWRDAVVAVVDEEHGRFRQMAREERDAQLDVDRRGATERLRARAWFMEPPARAPADHSEGGGGAGAGAERANCATRLSQLTRESPPLARLQCAWDEYHDASAIRATLCALAPWADVICSDPG